MDVPNVSILIAARNEAHNILRCLESVTHLEYPPQRWEVLIGDDQSEDCTAELIRKFIRDKPQFRLFSIQQTIGQQRGKANVLAQLARQASGDFLFFTDADMQLPPTWITGMLCAFGPDTGIVTGVTTVQVHRLFDGMQAMEWIQAIARLNRLANWNIPLTAMGNNMAIPTRVYQAIGGYERLPFSVVEDFQLFHTILRQPYGFRQLLQPDVLAFTQPASTFREMLQQRNRWMHGAMQLPWYWVALFIGQALLFPLFALLGFLFPKIALVTFAIGYGWDTGFLIYSLQKLGLKRLISYAFLFPFYQGLLSPVFFLFYWWNKPILWKGRMYTKSKEE